MAPTYEDVIRQIEKLSEQAEKLRLEELASVVTRVKRDIEMYRLTAEDLGLAPGPETSETNWRQGGRRSVVVRFRDEAGNTWVGRGPRPQWLRDALANGKQLKDFAV
jgi:DNA-binding protein H-NS